MDEEGEEEEEGGGEEEEEEEIAFANHTVAHKCRRGG